MPKYLVTGAAGFIGSHIATALVRRGDSVRVLDNLCMGHRSNLSEIESQIEFLEGDVADAEAVAEAVAGVDYVIHQAALASVPLSIERPLDVHRACATGTLNVLNESRKANVKRVIYAASSSCYGDQAFATNRETDPTRPLSPYAAAKLTGELYCQAFYHSFGLETVCLRYFNVFGPRQDPDSPYSAVIPLFITRLLAGQQPVVFGDGEQSRDFTYVENVVQGNLLAAERPGVAGRVFNLANGRSTTLNTLLRLLGELLEVEVRPDYRPARVGDIRDSMADISATRRELGYDPQIDFEEGLRRSIEYYRAAVETR